MNNEKKVTVKGDMPQQIPQPEVEVLDDAALEAATGGALEIALDRVSTSAMQSQQRMMMRSDGCISNPGGPSC